ncbi:hypothetical protein DBV15_11347, partial [Temnothorax longispinosus]
MTRTAFDLKRLYLMTTTSFHDRSLDTSISDGATRPSVAKQQVSQFGCERGAVKAKRLLAHCPHPEEQCGSGGSFIAFCCIYPCWHRIERPLLIRPLTSCSYVPFESDFSRLLWWWQFYCALLHISVLASDRKTALDTPFNIMFLRAFREWTFNAFGGRSSKVPESVHKLRPGDIDVIAAMGDSLTAGAGIFAGNLLQILIENRGVTAAGGGQGTWRQYLTLPNIIKALVETREGRPSLNCFLTTDFECSCMFGLTFRRFRSMYYDIMRQWQKLDMEIATYPEFQKDDFTVVAQPILVNLTIPLGSDGYTDMTYLSSDCFHVSQKTNALFANSLWNNLLEPVGGRSSKVPKSVHKLRPGDIDVIAAMGDSLATGAGIFAASLLQIAIENRGVTAAGGGQGTWRQYLTLPNIIKEFNPNLIGYALGDSLTTHQASQLNVAEGGAMSADMVYMADALVKKIKNDPRIDLQKHWKFISLMIGCNDFCSEMCWIPSPWSVLETHKTDLLQALRTLRDNLPRTFVALLPPPHLKAIVETRERRPSLNCFLAPKVLCSCMFGLTFQRFRSTYYDIMRHIPFASDGYTDMTYLSSDCLHVSQKTNALFANSLWNNLLEPVGAKSTKWSNNKFHCPTPERLYLTTITMWKWWQFYCALLHISVLASDRKTVLDTPFNIMLHRAIREWTFNAFGGRSSKVPESVHKLRPGDIDVIATMGDSLMAGAGIFADNLFQILIENRGVTMTGGGQGTWRQYLTVPNIIKEFNPNLIGYALGDSLTTDKASQLNVAESGAMSADMVYMADMLVKKIKNDPRIDLQKHWKFISLMIGSNDFCSKICWIPSPWSVLETHKTDLLQALRTLRDNLPRTFVALLPPPHLKAMVEIREEKPSLNCFLGTKFVCSCMFGLTSWRFRSMWQKLDMEIATYSEFQRDDFTVVTQPILVNFSIPFASNGYTDMTYLSRDCLHVIANSLWNNLFEPVGAKSTRWNNNKFRCPTQEKPYLTTMLNSKQQSFNTKIVCALSNKLFTSLRYSIVVYILNIDLFK